MARFSWPFARRPRVMEEPLTTSSYGDAPASALAQRTYLDGTPYLLPKDAEENGRLHFQHYALQQTFGTHFLAPLSPTTRTILDVGCGTGIWAFDMAQQFPQAHILGVDISLASLPHTVPSTCLFCQTDVLGGLPFPDQQFDYAHQRLLVFAIPPANWPGVVRELVRVTRPQGWIELLEAGAFVQNAGPATERLLDWLRETTQALGIDLRVVTQLGSLLQQAGCQMVESQELPVPLGAWAGRSGEMLKADAIRVFQTLQPRSSLPPEPFAALLAEASEEWERRQARYVFYLAYGRRVSLP